jgi:hypothetical protein
MKLDLRSLSKDLKKSSNFEIQKNQTLNFGTLKPYIFEIMRKMLLNHANITG